MEDNVIPFPQGNVVECCLGCGDPFDHCHCHGPTLQMLWNAHDNGDHSHCHPNGCDEVESLQ